MPSFSIFKNIPLNYIKFTSLRSHNIFPRLFYFSRSYTSLKDMDKAFLINRTYQSTPGILKVEFNDSLSADFHYSWLRDSCRCIKCVHPKSQQKLFDTTSLKLDIIPRFCCITNKEELKIVWYEGNADHVSLYDPKWLYRYGLGFEKDLYETVHDILPPTENWTGKALEKNLPEIEYEEVMQSPMALKRSLENIHKYGILFIRNVPCVPGEVVKVMNRIANIKLTRWGSSFHLTTDDVAHNSANKQTGKFIQFHTAMDYLEKSPGIQSYHYLEATNCNDGDSRKLSDELCFVDGFYAAEWLKTNYPVYFNTLASVPVKFRLFTRNMEYFNYQPILRLNRSRNISEVHFNNRLMAPLEGPSKSILHFYAAYKTFGEYIRESENLYRFPFHPGDMVVVNNRRVLHENHFTTVERLEGTRKLEGCFSDLDEVLARYRSFLKQKHVNEEK